MLLALTSACGAAGIGAPDKVSGGQGNAVSANPSMPGPPGGVPVNQRFASLDDYLAWLRDTQRPVDGPWYEEVRPGVYALRSGNLRVLEADGEQGARSFTRAQLLKQFGFAK